MLYNIWPFCWPFCEYFVSMSSQGTTIFNPPSKGCGWVKNKLGIVYLVAFIFIIIALAVYYAYYAGRIYRRDLCALTLASTFFLLLYNFLSYVTEELYVDEYTIHGLIFGILHGVLNIIAGVFMILESKDRMKKSYKTRMYLGAVLEFILAILIIVVAVLVFKDRNK
uniref:MARVEL domain-containing protein n=1 Tax=Strigamia maritima TaxID=126957 RepID=T1IX74_STRMM